LVLLLKYQSCRPFIRPIDSNAGGGNNIRPIDSTAGGGHNIRPPLATPLAGFCRHNDLSTCSVIGGGILDQITDYQLLQNFSLTLLNSLSIKHPQIKQYVATSQPLLRIHFNMFQPLKGHFQE